MDHIHSLVRLAGRRLAITDFLRWLRDVSIIALVVICVYLGLERLAIVPDTPWFWWIPPVLVVAVLVTVFLWLQHQQKHMNVAIKVDQELGLDERLSSALLLADSSDPFARAAIDDAIRTASSPQTRERVGRTFKIQAPKGWWMPFILIAVAVGLLFTPTMATEDERTDSQVEQLAGDTPEQAKEEVLTSVSAVEEAIAQDEALAQAMEEALRNLNPDEIEVREDTSATEIRQDAIKKVTELNRRLEELLDSEQGQTTEVLKEMLENLAVQSEKSKATDALANALARGDFKAAQEALQRLQEEIEQAGASGNEDEQAALAKQLAEMAAQLDALAQQQDQLAEALERAGLDGQLAKNPDALKQALQQNQNLTERQKEQLQKMAAAQTSACKQCDQMSQSMQQMAQACQQGGEQAGGQAGKQLSQQLSRMEMMQQMVNQAKAAQEMCVSQCQSIGQGAGKNRLSGAGQGSTGGEGQGSGGSNSVEETAVSMTDVKANIVSDQGDVIARELFDGKLMPGISTAPMQEVLRNAVDGFEEGISEDPLPPYYDEVQKHYFGELEQLIEALDAANQNSTPVEEPESSQDDNPTDE